MEDREEVEVRDDLKQEENDLRTGPNLTNETHATLVDHVMDFI